MSRFSVGDQAAAFRDVVRTDTTTNRVKTFIVEGAPRLPRATKYYLLDKVPIVQWLPRYHPSWLLQDFIAGLTIGVMLIPQGLAYAKIATIPIENGLYSAWVPAAVMVIMGTSKDLSSGPTSILGLLTAEIVESYSEEYSPAAIASAVAFMVGIYSLILGVLGLGFLLDYVSVPVLTGFISATALTIGFGQLGSLIGLSNTPSMIFDIIGDALKRLPHWDGPTCGIGVGSILILIALEQLGKKLGNKHFVIKYISSSRAIIVLFVFTLISYLVNKDRSKTLWGIAQVSTHGIATPKAHDSALLTKAASRAFAPLIACALEHLAVGKAFGRRNSYTIDQTQELNYLGVTNVINSFFGAMPVGGAMSRTAVNSECRVRSPLNGLVTAAWIVLTIYVFSPALYWIPKATLAAIIIMAVINLFGPVSLFYRYWRMSMADFVASMLSFWITIFVSAEIGIGVGVAWSIVWSLLRSAFVKPDVEISREDTETSASLFNNGFNTTRDGPLDVSIPKDMAVVRFTDSIFFPNAHRSKSSTTEAIQLVYDKIPDAAVRRSRERSWSVAAEKRVERIRKDRNIILRDVPLSVVIFDFTMVSWIDTTGILALGELKADIRLHCGREVQFRFVGMNKHVRKRFARALWQFTESGEMHKEGVDTIYLSHERAITDRERLGSVLEAVIAEKSAD
ncbi:hypothetical protein JX265_007761 [Neoarthrinium moseri]|uniref:STAS domain-containing protein n=1 Tax=Neoarthrinium moseri TaxID=1658444 RepID=A0A9P9WJC0_9PEZI|nr:hypothetical protein JX266_010460 [Neoarthrinium moseri]KAI1866460.1 hypothetical protein JX265_007761 [Neoarthrinium moseri]